LRILSKLYAETHDIAVELSLERLKIMIREQSAQIIERLKTRDLHRENLTFDYRVPHGTYEE
jgi:hypothetical protein